jgi:hypothetical protein
MRLLPSNETAVDVVGFCIFKTGYIEPSNQTSDAEEFSEKHVTPYIYIYIFIYLYLTANGFSPGGSDTTISHNTHHTK